MQLFFNAPGREVEYIYLKGLLLLLIEILFNVHLWKVYKNVATFHYKLLLIFFKFGFKLPEKDKKNKIKLANYLSILGR